MRYFGNKLIIVGILTIVLPFFGYTERSLAGETYGVCLGVGLIAIFIGFILKSLSDE